MMIVTMQPIDCIVGTNSRAMSPMMIPAKSPEIIPVISMGIANHISSTCDDNQVKIVWPGPELELTAPELASAYPWPPSQNRSWVRANMVMSLDGSVTGPDGLSKSISSPADRALLGLLRRDADVILVGASTIRAENYGPAAVPFAIVSISLDLPAGLAMFTQATTDAPRSMILTSQAAIDRAPDGLSERVDLIACGSEVVDLHQIVKVLANLGLARIHCEGGPTLLTGLLQAKLLNELLLTISPVLVGSTQHLADRQLIPPITAKPEQLITESGSIFLRYLLTAD